MNRIQTTRELYGDINPTCE